MCIHVYVMCVHADTGVYTCICDVCAGRYGCACMWVGVSYASYFQIVIFLWF